MKAQEPKRHIGGWNVPSVLACGNPLAPFDGKRFAGFQSPKGATPSKTWRRFATGLLLVALAASSAAAQTYSIDWYKVSGGGGTSTGGTYSVSGTIGQHDAGGPVSGGNYSLTGGFWSLISVVQTPGLPNLTITQSGNSVKVSWPNTGSYTLQQTANLAAGIGGWVTSGYTITTTNGTNSIAITPPTGNLFFRLKQ